MDYYKKYRFNLNRDKTLSIYAKRDEILAAIKGNPVVILKGETGCGKTTQVPQYILDEGFMTGQYCNIVVAQPRRIAAISIANRVCEERHWQLGTVCGYQVGLHRETGDDTRLLYCTTGVLLNMLIHNKTLTHYTHIVLDEVHERDQDMDFLLIVVRRLLATNSCHELDATSDQHQSWTETLDEKFYRDQLTSIKWKDDVEGQNEPRILEDGYKAALKIILIINNMERQAERHSGVSYHEAMRQGAVLIFLPGIYEIECMADSITNLLMQDNSMKINIISGVVFESPPSGYRKVILATNIAESSITVPDVSTGQYCNIVVTQPRRIAAISIANRVCEERQWQPRTVCSYQVGLHRATGDDTRLLYCTTGVLLNKLIHNKTLPKLGGRQSIGKLSGRLGIGG
nr:probable ATP-dependent RNA helicase spindle-E [Drosophila kikkawai]